MIRRISTGHGIEISLQDKKNIVKRPVPLLAAAAVNCLGPRITIKGLRFSKPNLDIHE